MSVSLTPYLLNVSSIEALGGSKDKSLQKRYFGSNKTGWLQINNTIKREGLQGIITGKMLFEDILNGQFRFPEYGYLYAMAVEVIIQAGMSQDMGIKLSIAFKYGHHNNEWSPCNVKVLEHLPYKIPISIPALNDSPYISTIYNREIDSFIDSLDLSDCTGQEGDQQFRSWFTMAKEYQKDVVLFLW